MKTIISGVAIFLMAILVLPAWAQKDITDDVKEAIRAGSAKELAKFMHQNVDVTIETSVESYSKAQAEFVLRDFFKAHPPSSFNIVHQGASRGGLIYAIGKYVSGDDNFRLYMRIKTTNQEYQIHEISFIKE